MILSKDRSALSAFSALSSGDVSPAIWKALHDNDSLALHAAIYTWSTQHIRRGRALDLGCEVGLGGLLIAEANNSLDIVGIDLDLAALRYSHNILGKRGASYVQGDAYRLPVVAESFAGIYMIHLLHLVEEPSMVLSEVRRVLERGGVAFVSAPCDEARSDDRLRSAINGQFSEVFYPSKIWGQLPSYSAQSFRMDKPTSAWLAVCRKD